MATLNPYGFVTSVPEAMQPKPTILDFLLQAYMAQQQMRDSREDRALKQMEMQLRQKQVDAQTKNLERQAQEQEREAKEKEQTRMGLEAFRSLLSGRQAPAIIPTTVPTGQVGTGGEFTGNLPPIPPLPGMSSMPPSPTPPAPSQNFGAGFGMGQPPMISAEPAAPINDPKQIMMYAMQNLPPEQFDNVARLMNAFQPKQQSGRLKILGNAGGIVFAVNDLTGERVEFPIGSARYKVAPDGTVIDMAQFPANFMPAVTPGDQPSATSMPTTSVDSSMYQMPPTAAPAPISEAGTVDVAAPPVSLPTAPPPIPPMQDMGALPNPADAVPPEPSGSVTPLYSETGGFVEAEPTLESFQDQATKDLSAPGITPAPSKVAARAKDLYEIARRSWKERKEASEKASEKERELDQKAQESDFESLASDATTVTRKWAEGKQLNAVAMGVVDAAEPLIQKIQSKQPLGAQEKRNLDELWIALNYAYAKALDPDSAVREPEYQRMGFILSDMDQWRRRLYGIKEGLGVTMTPEMWTAMFNGIRRLNDVYDLGMKGYQSRLLNRIRKYSKNPEDMLRRIKLRVDRMSEADQPTTAPTITAPASTTKILRRGTL